MLIVALAIVIWIGGTAAVLDETVDGIVTIIAFGGLIGGLAYIGFVLWDWLQPGVADRPAG